MANNEIEPRSGAELARLDDPGLAALAEGLVAAARAQGVQLTGPGGLLSPRWLHRGGICRHPRGLNLRHRTGGAVHIRWSKWAQTTPSGRSSLLVEVSLEPARHGTHE
jgi:hypothetical protein